MPTISKIRLTNIMYEGGDKRFNDEIFSFNGENSAIVLENGGGKTVLIHTALQAVLPHTDLGDRKIKETLKLENTPAHIGIEWIISEHPRRYLTTAVTLFQQNNRLTSYRYAFEYEEGHQDALSHMPFVIRMTNGKKRPAYKEELSDYYSMMKKKTHNAMTFTTISDFHEYLEDQYQIIHEEWKSIVKINADEGGIAAFFDHCKTSTELFNRLIIPMVEDSIAGHETNMFADTFEKQRESFQMYRNLKNSMKEHEIIQDALEAYVDECKHYTEQLSGYQVEQSRAKGMQALLQEHKDNNELEAEAYEAEWHQWKTADHQLKIEKASHEITGLQRKAEALITAYKQEFTNQEALKESLQTNDLLLNALQYAKYREEKRIYEQQSTNYKKELQAHDTAHNMADDEEQLTAVKQALRGYYVTMLENIDRVISDLTIEKSPLAKTLEEWKDQLQDAALNKEKVKKTQHIMTGNLETYLSRNDTLKQKLLANPEQENVQTAFETWTAREQTLDENIIAYDREKKSIHEQIKVLTTDKDEVRASMTTLDLELNDMKRDEQYIKEAEDKLKEKLQQLRPSWQSLENLYLQESRISAALYDMQDKKRKERENALYKERIASRFVDDYDEQNIFFADPFLAERLMEWQRQFYIMSGLEYMQNLTETDRAQAASYQFWPITLVTNQDKKLKLQQKVAEIKKRLQYPVIILSLEEATLIGTGGQAETWITPLHWEENQTQAAFQNWKADIRQEAIQMTELRIKKDTEMSYIETVVQHFEQFFTDYPKTMNDQLQEKLAASHKEKEQLQRTIEKIEKSVQQQGNNRTTTEEKLQNAQAEKNGLERKIEQANDYLQNEKTIKALRVSMKEQETAAKKLDEQIKQLKRSTKRYQAEKDALDKQIADQKQEIRMLKAEPLYKEVRDETPQFTDASKPVLLDQKQTLEDRIRGIRQQYEALELKVQQATKDITRMNQAMTDIKADNEMIDTDMTFPVDGEHRIKETKQFVQKARQQLEGQREAVDRARDNKIEAETRAQETLENFKQTFPDEQIVSFIIDLEEVPAYLAEKGQALTKRKVYLDNRRQMIEKEKQDIEAAIHHLDKYEVAHGLKNPEIIATPPTETIKTAFPYERMTYVEKTTTTLETEKGKLEEATRSMEREKEDFRHFCRENIREHKLRKMAIDGIETKKTYDEILTFRQHMTTTLEHAQMQARDFISKNDKDIQAFINNVHNHLVNVIDQMRNIPKNTRVKIGEKWKEIYAFTIPEWTEEDGKAKLRDHMDWILKQLESDRFNNEEGREDHMKVRKEVEKWLHTRQLLHIIMGHHTMKAACRKVTNDNQVTSRLTTWEESNKWSGGEKWSKNMTLFLGILNFVAEKKQHITSNMQRHRAVILDNPFGKASSDHVLNPVFFIAEQLGFQMIALTAHADGKFLQDYFPVNFSCRLVPAIDSSAQIMTKEKNLEQVYFQDHEPEEMARLEEREQMELF